MCPGLHQALNPLPARNEGGGPRRGETNKNAPPLPSPLLHPMEEREKSRSLMQPWSLAIQDKICLTSLVYSARMPYIPTRVPGVTGQRPCEEKTSSGPANENERWNAGIQVSWRRVTRLARVVPSLIQE